MLLAVVGLALIAPDILHAVAPTGSDRCGCTAGPQRSASEWFERSTSVLTGLVISVSPTSNPPGMLRWHEAHAIVGLAVIATEKGEPATSLEILTPSDPEACGFRFRTGATYRVYASNNGAMLARACEPVELVSQAPLRSVLPDLWLDLVESARWLTGVALLGLSVVLARRSYASRSRARP